MKKAGDLPAWGQIGVALISALLCAGAAWGAAATKLAGIERLESEMQATRLAVCSLVSLEVGRHPERATSLMAAMEACKPK